MKDLFRLQSIIINDVTDQDHLIQLLTQITRKDQNLAHAFGSWVHWLANASYDLDFHQCSLLRYRASKLDPEQPIAVLTSYWPSETAARHKQFVANYLRDNLNLTNPIDLFPLGRWSNAEKYPIIALVSHARQFIIHDDSHWLEVPANVLASFLTRKIFICDLVGKAYNDQMVLIHTEDGSIIRALLQDGK